MLRKGSLAFLLRIRFVSVVVVALIAGVFNAQAAQAVMYGAPWLTNVGLAGPDSVRIDWWWGYVTRPYNFNVIIRTTDPSLALNNSVQSFSGDSDTATVTGLPPATYTFQIYGDDGSNDVGPSAFTRQIVVPQPSVQGVTTFVGSDRIGVRWRAFPRASGYLISATPVDGGTPAVMSTSTLSATLTGLLPGTTYDVDVLAQLPDGKSSSSAARRLTTKAVPVGAQPAPTVVWGVSSARLSWIAGDGATAWRIAVASAAWADGQQTYVTSDRTTVVPALTPGVDYTITVTPLNAAGTAGTPATVTGQVSGTGLPTVVDAPTMSQSDAAVVLTAPTFDSPVTKWRVVLESDSGAQRNQWFIGSGSDSLVLGGLTPGASYTVRAQGRSLSGAWGPVSNSSNALTVAYWAPPGAASVSVRGTSVTSALVNWTPSDQSILGWTLTIGGGKGAARDGEVVSLPATTRSYEATGLTRGKEYSFEVRGIGPKGTSDAATASWKSPIGDEVSDFTVTAQGRAITVTWFGELQPGEVWTLEFMGARQSGSQEFDIWPDGNTSHSFTRTFSRDLYYVGLIRNFGPKWPPQAHSQIDISGRPRTPTFDGDDYRTVSATDSYVTLTGRGEPEATLQLQFNSGTPFYVTTWVRQDGTWSSTVLRSKLARGLNNIDLVSWESTDGKYVFAGGRPTMHLYRYDNPTISSAISWDTRITSVQGNLGGDVVGDTVHVDVRDAAGAVVASGDASIWRDWTGQASTYYIEFSSPGVFYNGTYTATATVNGQTGSVSSTASVTATTKCNGWFLTPAADSSVPNEPVTISGTSGGNPWMSSIKVSIDGTSVFTSNYRYINYGSGWDTNNGAANWSFVATLSPGVHTLTLESTSDCSGAPFRTTRSFTVSGESAPLVVNPLPSGASRSAKTSVSGTTGQSRNISVVVKDASGATVMDSSVKPQGTRTAAGFSWNLTLPDFGDGTFTVTVTQVDDSGSTATASSTWTVDRTGPALVLEETPTVDGDGLLSFYGTSTIGDGPITVTVGGKTIGSATADPVNGQWSLVSTKVAEGTVTVVVTQADALGNTTTITFKVFVDYTAPVLAFTSVENLAAGTISVSGTTDDIAPVNVWVWSSTTCSAVPSTATSFILVPTKGTWRAVATGLPVGSVCISASQTDVIARTVTLTNQVVSRDTSSVSAVRTGSGLAVDSETIAIAVTGADTGTVQVTRYGRLYSTTQLVNGIASVWLSRGYANEPISVAFLGNSGALPSSTTVNVSWLGAAKSAFDYIGDSRGSIYQNKTINLGPYDLPVTLSSFMRAVDISALPTGTVQVVIDGKTVSSMTLPWSNFYGFYLGLPTLTSSMVEPGVHTLFLRYLGDTTFAPQSSATYTLIVGSGLGTFRGGVHRLTSSLDDIKGVVGKDVTATLSVATSMLGSLTNWQTAGEVVARVNGAVVARSPLTRGDPTSIAAIGTGSATLVMRLPTGRNTIVYTWEMDGTAFPFQIGQTSVQSATQSAVVTSSDVVITPTVMPVVSDVLRPGEAASLTVRVADKGVTGTVSVSGAATVSGAVACVTNGCQVSLALPAAATLRSTYTITFTSTDGATWVTPLTVTRTPWTPSIVMDSATSNPSSMPAITGRVVWPMGTPASIRQAVNVTIAEKFGHIQRNQYGQPMTVSSSATVQPGTDDGFQAALSLAWGPTPLIVTVTPIGDHSTTSTTEFTYTRAGRSTIPMPIVMSDEDVSRAPRAGEGMIIILPFDVPSSGRQDPVRYEVFKAAEGGLMTLRSRSGWGEGSSALTSAPWRLPRSVSAIDPNICGADLTQMRCPVWSPTLMAPGRLKDGTTLVGWPIGLQNLVLRLTYPDGTAVNMPFTVNVEGWPGQSSTSLRAGSINSGGAGTTGVNLSVQPSWRNLPIWAMSDPYLGNGSYSASHFPTIEGGVTPQRVSVSLAVSFIDSNGVESNVFGLAQCALSGVCPAISDKITYKGTDYTPKIEAFSDAANRLQLHITGLPPAAQLRTMVTVDAPWSDPIVKEMTVPVATTAGTGGPSVNGVTGFYEGAQPQDVDLSKIIPIISDIINGFAYTKGIITAGIKSVFGDNGFSDWLADQITGLLDPLSWVIGFGAGKLLQLGLGPLMNLAFKSVFPNGLHTFGGLFMKELGWSLKSAVKYAATTGLKNRATSVVSEQASQLAQAGWDEAVDKLTAARETQNCIINDVNRCVNGAVFSIHTVYAAADVVPSTTVPRGDQSIVVDMDNNAFDRNRDTGRTVLATCTLDGVCSGVPKGQQVTIEGGRVWVHAFGDPSDLGFNPSNLRVRIRLVGPSGDLAGWSWSTSTKDYPLTDAGDRAKAHTWLQQQDPKWHWQQGLPFVPWGPALSQAQQDKARDDEYLRIARLLGPGS